MAAISVRPKKRKHDVPARKTRISSALAQRVSALLSETRCKPTDHHVTGPFYRPGAPLLTDLYPADNTGPVLYFDATVTDSDCKFVPAVLVEVWQADDRGNYDNGDPQHPPAPDFFRCRGKFTSLEDGTFRIRTVLPANYKVDDPEQSWTRVKHLHFKLHAAGFQPLTTEIELLPDEYSKNDPLFNPGLAVELQKLPGERGREAFRVNFGFVLSRISSSGYLIAAARIASMTN
jgi:protocatechuate 3,4-dioxygenase beta subunit